MPGSPSLVSAPQGQFKPPAPRRQLAVDNLDLPSSGCLIKCDADSPTAARPPTFCLVRKKFTPSRSPSSHSVITHAPPGISTICRLISASAANANNAAKLWLVRIIIKGLENASSSFISLSQGANQQLNFFWVNANLSVAEFPNRFHWSFHKSSSADLQYCPEKKTPVKNTSLALFKRNINTTKENKNRNVIIFRGLPDITCMSNPWTRSYSSR